MDKFSKALIEAISMSAQKYAEQSKEYFLKHGGERKTFSIEVSKLTPHERNILFHTWNLLTEKQDLSKKNINNNNNKENDHHILGEKEPQKFLLASELIPFITEQILKSLGSLQTFSAVNKAFCGGISWENFKPNTKKKNILLDEGE
jgi:hypothetical protein